MKFQHKIIVVYTILGILISMVVGSVYYALSINRYREQEKQGIKLTTEQLIANFKNMIQSMEDVSYSMLSDKEVLDAIIKISHAEPEKMQKVEKEYSSDIRSSMNTAYIGQQFYRVIYCNDKCAPIANNLTLYGSIRQNVDYKDLPWYELAENNQKSTYTIYGIYRDPWGTKENTPEVFSVIKQIQGERMGYIEVQKKLDDVRNVLGVANPNIHIILMDSKQRILYQDQDAPLPIMSVFEEESNLSQTVKTDTGDTYFVTKEYNDTTDTWFCIYESENIMKQNRQYTLWMTVFLTISILLVSFTYILIAARQLMKPVQELQEVIRNTKLENLNQPMEWNLQDENMEFKEMGRVFEDMKSRLSDAIVREQHLSMLQLQAHFDMLQAQVNPHFIYNTLNVISNRGIMDDDEVICDICADLAGMLRYATDTSKKYASVYDEITYLKLYFSLLKFRYEHKLQYYMEIDPDIEQEILPKLTIQQMVENCIAHGYVNSSRIMKISVEGYRDDSYWYIRIRDNGDGFDQDVLNQLNQKMEVLREELLNKNKNLEMKIGGMGILNTYARCSLFYNDSFVFQLGNYSDGAEIIIGALRKDKSGE